MKLTRKLRDEIEVALKDLGRFLTESDCLVSLGRTTTLRHKVAQLDCEEDHPLTFGEVESAAVADGWEVVQRRWIHPCSKDSWCCITFSRRGRCFYVKMDTHGNVVLAGYAPSDLLNGRLSALNEVQP